MFSNIQFKKLIKKKTFHLKFIFKNSYIILNENYIDCLAHFYFEVYLNLSFTLTSLYYLLNFHIFLSLFNSKKPTLINKVGFYKLINLQLLQL